MQSDFRDWSDLRVFLAVVRAGSTLAASKSLGLAQPTVARRIDALEHALGLVLFQRNTRGFQPTPDARALIDDAELMENAAIEFSNKARQLTAGKSRTIRITAFKDAFNHRFSSVIQAFTALHSNVHFEFVASDDVIDIGAGEADVALRIAAQIDDPSLICRKIRDLSYSLFASKGYAAKQPLPSSEAEFSGHTFAVHEGLLASYEFSKWLLARIDPDQIAMTCDHPKAMEAAVLMGVGLGPFPTSLRNNDNFIHCLKLPPETDVPIWLVVNPAAYRRPEVKAFTAFFVPRYRAMFRDS